MSTNEPVPSSFIESLHALREKAFASLEVCQNEADLESHFYAFLGKKGSITLLLKGLKDLDPETRRSAGQQAHQLRQELDSLHQAKRSALKQSALQEHIKQQRFDALRPLNAPRGSLHPVSIIQAEVEDIFSRMGFAIMDGPEVESDANNFERLNFSADHPARDMQDTIWTQDGNLMRTHTSCVQVRSMQVLTPPFRIIAPGRVFRYEETDASHENTFHQVEGMMIGENISVANLIHIMKSFLSTFFERELAVRLRPGYFPFVEPGFELDASCLMCGGSGCQTCKQSGWIELLPCGLVHPNVLQLNGINPQRWNGFAFGLGLDRLVMLRYNIKDIRYFMSGNLRFLKQF
ncbi:MAG: phenylalanine--tRNA ligase subunit alpha [Leptospiraceae bacterium]|nr:phenylalanine--tRNA ligase subunit alpha [Leptospiraceae bacterium]